MSGQQHDPAALYPWDRQSTHFTGGWVGPRAGLDGRKISPPPGFDPRTAQPVASRYTDYATRPTKNAVRAMEFRSFTNAYPAQLQIRNGDASNGTDCAAQNRDEF